MNNMNKEYKIKNWQILGIVFATTFISASLIRGIEYIYPSGSPQDSPYGWIFWLVVFVLGSSILYLSSRKWEEFNKEGK
jgi:hypothetical protein